MIPRPFFGILYTLMFGFLGRKIAKKSAPVICERAQHCISRKNIDPDALKVLYRLSSLGYTAYLVGGGVRDLLLGRQPKRLTNSSSEMIGTPSDFAFVFLLEEDVTSLLMRKFVLDDTLPATLPPCDSTYAFSASRFA